MSRSLPARSEVFTPEALQTFTLPQPLRNITWEEALDGSTGKGVKVAVIDSGIDATHPAVNGVQGYMAFEESSEGIVYDAEPHEDSCGHGTACAGIIRSIAPDCELYSVKVLGKFAVGRGNIFAMGIRWAIENGMNVCNLSLGTTKKEYIIALHDLADLAYFSHVSLVTAANNFPVPSFPSLYASVISVASHEKQDSHHFYYNPEPPVEFGAPGIDVRVPWLGHQWFTVTGNSFAAPHISGIVARLLGKHPGLTPFEVKTVLRSLAANASRPDITSQW
jgi:subtilisin family serine protease